MQFGEVLEVAAVVGAAADRLIAAEK